MGFEQATIKVEKSQEFAELRTAVEQAFQSVKVERFLKLLDRKGIRIRDFDAVLAAKALEDAAGEAGFGASKLYQSLTLSDQRRCGSFICRSWKR